jgi:hypothetical protein
MLFNSQFTNQKSGVCMKCHQEAASHQEEGVLNNYDYSVVHGGETDKDCPASIRKQFWFIKYDTRLPRIYCDTPNASGSAHDLKNIRAYMKNEWEWGWGGTNAEVNPCGTCHNPHQATKEYPCSKPSSHSGTWEIWGDDPVDSGKNEKMADYLNLEAGEIYLGPNKAGGGSERDADTQPNYVEFCLECHSTSQNSFQHGTVTAIDWENADMGKAAANRDWSPLKSPYDDPSSFGKYVLCCTDCHEPHGSRNEWLLRTEVNGRTGIEINEAREWWDFCTACHEDPHSWVNPPETGDSRANCYGGIGLFRVGYGF